MSEAVAAVEAMLSLPEEQLDYARAKIAFDRIVDPSIDEQWVLAELDRLTEAARGLAGASAGEAARLNALRKLIYESGPWNEHRPYAYDMSDPLGRKMANKLLANYLRNRLGQCVSMPILFLILAERLGLNVALSNAPSHMFVRYRDKAARTFNLETTSGAYPTREEWIRQNFPMSELALSNGLYLRFLLKKEAVAHIASTVSEHLMAERRYDELISLSQVILEHWPRDIHALLSLGSACGYLIETFKEKYPAPILIPPPLRPRYLMLVRGNATAFDRAAELGWEPEAENRVAM